MRHTARLIPFEELYLGLMAAKKEGWIRESLNDEGLALYCYTEACTYEKKWNFFTQISRGLILDLIERRVVATPFPKFFNYGEIADKIPDNSFESFEKLDGSLIIIFNHRGKWKAATKGSFKSSQAKWAQEKLDEIKDLDHHLYPDCTYLAEAIYRENRIVVPYDQENLHLLGGYYGDGSEFDYVSLKTLGSKLELDVVERHDHKDLKDLLEIAKTLPKTREGFVVKFSDGFRLKIKGDEYCRIHKMISHLSPLALWEMMKAGDDLEVLRKKLPEEFWPDFDLIEVLLKKQITNLVSNVSKLAKGLEKLTDKEVGLMLDKLPTTFRSFVFPYRKNKGDLLVGRSREAVFRAIRPDSNVLEGYAPSSSINRVLQE